MMRMQPRYFNFQELISNRLFRIPQYQRSYSWGRRQRRELFNDIDASFAADKPTDHFMATVVALATGHERVPGSAAEHLRVDIVDGQQRITTLILLLKAIAKALDVSDQTQETLRIDLERTLVKADSVSLLLLQTNHDTSNHFADYIRFGEYADADDAATLADREILRAMKECEDYVRDWQRSARPLEDLLAHLYNRLTFIYHEIDNEGLVYTVFEVLNSRGLDVSWFDRLKSMLMAIVFESRETSRGSEIIDEVHSLWSQIYRIVGLRMGMSTESLRFAATLFSDSAPSRPLGEEAAVEYLRDKARNGPADVIQITKWLTSVTEAVDKVMQDHRLNGLTDIQQARLVATAVNLRSNLESADKERILRRWESVTFRIYGMHGRDARTAVGDYTRLAWQIVQENYSTESILRALERIGREYPIEGAVDQLRKTNCYEKLSGNELRYFFYRYEEYLTKRDRKNFDNHHWNHIWAVEPSRSIEHILPQSSSDAEHIHWLGNLLLLPPDLNSKLRNSPPEYKAQSYIKTGMGVALEVAQQIATGWDRTAIGNREEELLSWAKQEWAD